jgi:hypothetical protein
MLLVCATRIARNDRVIRKIEISKEGDGAFAVVDIDTLWIDEAGNHNHWKAACAKSIQRLATSGR